MLDRETQGVRPARFALEILGAPNLAVALIDRHRRIEEDRRWRVAVVERGGVDERLEGGAGLALRLGRPVELGFIK